MTDEVRKQEEDNEDVESAGGAGEVTVSLHVVGTRGIPLRQPMPHPCGCTPRPPVSGLHVSNSGFSTLRSSTSMPRQAMTSRFSSCSIGMERKAAGRGPGRLRDRALRCRLKEYEKVGREVKMRQRQCRCHAPEGHQRAHTGQTRCETGYTCVSKKIDGKIECVKMGQGLEAFRKQREVTVTDAAALQPQQLKRRAVGQPPAQRCARHGTDRVSV